MRTLTILAFCRLTWVWVPYGRLAFSLMHVVPAVALARHRDRVHLSEDDWNVMVDYLAQDKPPAPATP